MNWNEDKSVKLSKICVYLCMVIFAGVCIGAPWLFRYLVIEVQGEPWQLVPMFLTTVYLGAVPAAAALWDVRKMLLNIGHGEVFEKKNVQILRRLSWYCIAAGGICLVSMLYYPPFLMFAIAAFFIGLILRVVKNVFAEAVRLKEENDYTI